MGHFGWFLGWPLSDVTGLLMVGVRFFHERDHGLRHASQQMLLRPWRGLSGWSPTEWLQGQRVGSAQWARPLSAPANAGMLGLYRIAGVRQATAFAAAPAAPVEAPAH